MKTEQLAKDLNIHKKDADFILEELTNTNILPKQCKKCTHLKTDGASCIKCPFIK